MKNLWEHRHPYYCETGNFFKNDHHTVFESWEEFAVPARFIDRTGNPLYEFDDDLNLLWRWDWKKADPSDFYLAPGDPDDQTAEFEEAKKSDRLLLFYMIQRKGYNVSAEVWVTEVDQPAVREWLTKKAAYMRKVWAPLLDGGAS